MPTTVETRAKIAFAVFLLLLGLAAGAWWLLESRRHAVYEIRSTDNVSGLIEGAPVEFHGVEVGRVKQVQLNGPRSVRILVEVERGAPVSSATVATITARGLATRGFTGYVYVALEDSGPAGQALVAMAGSAVPVIPSGPSKVSSLDTSIGHLDQSVQSAVALLQSVLDADTVASLKHSARRLDQLTSSLSSNSARMDTILANLQQASARVPPLLQSGGETLTLLRTQLLPQAQDTLVELNRLTASTDAAVRSVQDELLPQAQQAMSQFDQLATTLNQTASEVRRHPTVLLRGRPPVAPGPGEAP